MCRMGQGASANQKPSNSSAASAVPASMPSAVPSQAPSSVPSAMPSGLNYKPQSQGGKRYRKRRGGVAPLSIFDAPQHQPSQKIMNWATTAGGSRRRKHKSRRHRSRKHKSRKH